MRLARLFLIGLLPALLFGCASLSSDDDAEPPVELTDFDARFGLNELWSQDTGSGLQTADMVLSPVLEGNVIFTADPRGRIRAFDKTSGRMLWNQDLDSHITGALALTPDLVLAGSQEGELFAMSRQDGQLRWTRQLSSEILAPADGNQQTVVVTTQDGTLHALGAADGQELWKLDVQKPLLTLRGNGQPRVVEDRVYLGLDNGKVVAYRLADGSVIWEARVAVPEGTTELQRMVDVDTRPLIFSNLLFAIGYQGGLMAVDLETGTSSWFQEGSSRKDPAYFGGLITATMLDGQLATYSVTTGSQIWASAALQNRGVTAPVATEQYVAVGEEEDGYIHLLDRRTGAMLGRERVDSSGISATPLSDGTNLYVLDRDGRLYAYSLVQL